MGKKTIRKNIYYKVGNIEANKSTERIPWMKYAFEEVRREVCAVPGKNSNPRIEEYFNSTTNGAGLDDNTNWCGAFISWCFVQDGYDYKYAYDENSESSKEKRIPEYSCRAALWGWKDSGLAPAWKKIKTPVMGAIAIRESIKGIEIDPENSKFGSDGHINFVIGETDDGKYYYCLGGNQGGKKGARCVQVSKYPKLDENNEAYFSHFLVPPDYLLTEEDILPKLSDDKDIEIGNDKNSRN